MSVIVSNKVVLNTAQARTETLDGREYRAVPIVLMVDGVHVANAGPLYYPPEVNGKKPDDWNQRPLVVNHPQVNGKYVSARTANVIEHRQVGLVLNAGYSKPKTGGEAWFDVEKTNKVDDRIIPLIDEGKTLEVSAGYDLEYEAVAGEVDGQKYDGKVVNVHPDHVAILPDSVGACNTKKGCGCGVNIVVNELKPINNEASFDRIERALQDALYKQTDYNGYVRDVYKDFFVYSNNGKLYKRGYTATDTAVTISDGDPVQVQWVMEYRDMKGNFVGNSSLEPKEPTVADKKTLMTEILAFNAGYEQAELDKMDEPRLESVKDTLTRVKKVTAANTQKTEQKTEEKKGDVQKTEVQTPKTMTPKEWLVANNAPSIMHQIVERGMEYEEKTAKQHKDLIVKIVGNQNNRLSESTLQKMSVEELMAIDETITPAKVVVNEQEQVVRPWWGGNNVTTTVGNSGSSGGPVPLNPSNPMAGK